MYIPWKKLYFVTLSTNLYVYRYIKLLYLGILGEAIASLASYLNKKIMNRVQEFSMLSLLYLTKYTINFIKSRRVSINSEN